MKDLNELLLFQIDLTNKMARQHAQRAFDKRGMPIRLEQWIILKIIYESNAASQKEIAELSLRDPASITRSLDLLEKKELISRLSIEGNRRQYKIELTNKGSKFVEDNMPFVNELRKNSISGISKEELQLAHKVLEKMQENMK